MAFDELLADRVRGVIAAIDGEVSERKMFGGLAFLLNGHMFAGIVGDDLMVRLDAEGAQAALRREHVREMDFTGRPSKSMVYVAADGLQGAALSEWVTAAAFSARGLAAKRGHRGR